MISIIIATYNRNEWLDEAIYSALTQTIPCEIIVVNDGGNKVKVPNKVKYYYKEHTGAGDTLNYAIKHSTGDFIFNLDDDDVLAPNCCEKLFKAIKNKDIAFCDQILFGNKNKMFKQEYYGKKIMSKHNTIPGVIMTTRRIALKYPFDNNGKGYDHRRNIQFANDNCNFVHVPEGLYYYRQHDKQMSQGFYDN